MLLVCFVFLLYSALSACCLILSCLCDVLRGTRLEPADFLDSEGEEDSDPSRPLIGSIELGRPVDDIDPEGGGQDGGN